MTDDRCISEVAQHAIAAALRDVSSHTQLSGQDFSVSNLAMGQLKAAAERSLVTLGEFDCETNLTPRIPQHLRTIINIIDGRDQVQALVWTLEDRTLFSPDDAGWQSVYEFFSGRLQRYDKDLRKVHERLVIERLEDQIDRLTVKCETESHIKAVGLSELAHSTLNDAWDSVMSASELDDPSLTLIFELGACLLDLHHKIDVYREVFHPEQDGRSPVPQIDDLRMRSLIVIQFALMQMRCTKWIEKARNPDAVNVLRELTEFCRSQYDRTYSELADFLETERLLALQASFRKAIDRLTEPK